MHQAATTRPRKTERGAAAMLAVFILGVTFALFLALLTMIQSAKYVMGRQLTYEGQALNAAHAGLIDALAWFRRQQIQPVMTFAPQRDLSQTPPLNETDDAAIGLMRDFVISRPGRVRGRFEVRMTAVEDVSVRRGKEGPGTIWLLESEGIVYHQRDPSRPYDLHPNAVIARESMRTEIQRLTLVLPANAAINAARGDAVSSQSKTRLMGNKNIAIAYPPATGTPSTSGTVTGDPARSTVDPYNGGIPSVFGVSQQELINMADLVVSGAADLPADLPDMYLICVRGDAAFTPSRPLRGSGILVVFGSLTIDAGTASSFNGLIYVTGNYTQNAPSQVSGAIVGGGPIAIRGSSDFSEVVYDSAILTQIQRQMGQYRFNRNPNFLNREE